MKKNNIISTIVIVILAIIIIYFISKSPSTPTPIDTGPASTVGTGNTNNATSTATTTPDVGLTNGAMTVIGKSAEVRDINAYHYQSPSATATGANMKEIIFVGGIHGGYEWNTVLVAYKLMDYLSTNPTAIPANVKVTVIPVLNPDGLNTVVGTTSGNFTATDVSPRTDTVVAGRFNGNVVDLNRNFDCDWQATGKWQSKTVSGGTEAFSEPESQAIKNYVEANRPASVIVWYSAAGGVYASSCHNGVSEITHMLTTTFAKASGYPANEKFDFYATTGDMTNWLAKMDIPAVSVLLTNHTDTEWTKNLAGIKALFGYYSTLQ